MEGLQKVVNAETGSVFTVISKDTTESGVSILGAIRFYVHAVEDQSTVIGFRYRVEATGVDVVNLPHVLRSMYSKVKWGKLTAKHGSISGVIRVGYHVSDTAKLIEELLTSKVGESLFELLTSSFRSMEWAVDSAAFSSLQVTELSDLLYPDNEAAKGGVVLTFKSKVGAELPAPYMPPADLSDAVQPTTPLTSVSGSKAFLSKAKKPKQVDSTEPETTTLPD